MQPKPPRSARPAVEPLVVGSASVDVAREWWPAAFAERLAAVIDEPTLRRPLVVHRLEASVAVFVRLLDELPRTAEVVRRIGAGTYTIEPLGEARFHIADGRGASAEVDRVLCAPGKRIYYAPGRMSVPVLPTVRGRGVIVLRFEAAGESATLTGGQIHFRLDNRLLHTVLKRVVPLVYGAIDRKVALLTRAAIEACQHEASG